MCVGPGLGVSCLCGPLPHPSSTGEEVLQAAVRMGTPASRYVLSLVLHGHFVLPHIAIERGCRLKGGPPVKWSAALAFLCSPKQHPTHSMANSAPASSCSEAVEAFPWACCDGP